MINNIINVLRAISNICRNCNLRIDSVSKACKNLIELKFIVITLRLFSKWIINGIDIKGINEKNIDDRKFIYIPATVSNKAAEIGIETLSLILGMSISSIIVTNIETSNAVMTDILKKYKIINVVKKKAKLPSKDLSTSLVFP